MSFRSSFAALTIGCAVTLTAAPGAQTSVATLGVDALQPGMKGTGRTVFSGNRIEDFQVEILGVVKNVMGPKRDLIISRLQGGPLAQTGVIAGMSGSPVYIDGKLIGAVSYSLGSFPKEPIAGITPIADMTDAVNGGGTRTSTPRLDLQWPATPDQVYATIARLLGRAAGSIGAGSHADSAFPGSLGAMAAGLRPIGAAMVLGGFDPGVGQPLALALDARLSGTAAGVQASTPSATRPFEPGDPIGVCIVHGDYDVGATGTVTAVDGNRVYAFGHPFLELGPTAYPMTRASVLTVLPSLDSSLKIATLGPVVGTVTQDRSTALGGLVGPPPKELAINLTLSSDRGPDRHFSVFVVQDPILTPLFAYTTVLSALTSYERQVGVMSVTLSGTLSYGPDGEVAIDDVFTGDTALPIAAASIAQPLTVTAANEFRQVAPQTLDLRVRTSEQQDSVTIERAWLDTTMPRPGATVGVQVLLRHYRGATETVSIPVTMPSEAPGPLSLLVSDAPTLSALEQHEVDQSRPASFADTLADLNRTRRSNRLYVRLLATSPGTVVNGRALPTLPSSIQSVIDSDKSVATAALPRAIIGSWERRFDLVVKGSREIPVTLVNR